MIDPLTLFGPGSLGPPQFFAVTLGAFAINFSKFGDFPKRTC